MCGIAGVCNLNGEPVPVGLIKRMTDVIAHRGPDGEGQYTDGAVALGHRRLAIIDPSPAGHQPMGNEAGDVVITYNGEIYNFQKLRVELESDGHRFHSQTDTEVVVHAYEEWGEGCVDRFDGMFAFALHDRPRRRLFLARDRYGVKPLYWYCGQGAFVFASEIKAILEHPQVRRTICLSALDEYFTFQNIYSDLTLFEGIRLLPPGCTLTVDFHLPIDPEPRRYWDYSSGLEQSAMTGNDLADRLHQLFVEAVNRQLVSDVPVGAFLSGGMDSGSIVSVAARQLPRLTTFTGGFDLSSASGLEIGFDERQTAEMLSSIYKTEHYEVVMHAGDMERVMPDLIWHLEDLRVGQCYPNYYVSRLASKFVKVSLAGAGGDELFAGYPWRYLDGMQSTDRDDYFRRTYRYWQRLVSEEDKAKLFNEDTKIALSSHSTFDVFRGVFDKWPGPFGRAEDFVEASLYFELKTFLHGLLVVEDKLSMAHSLETRVPFLDNALVEFALGVPVRHKLLGFKGLEAGLDVDLGSGGRLERETNEGKMILRKAMERLIPQQIVDRPKQGFSAPDASWFRGESIDYLNRLLRDPKARIYDFLTPGYVSGVLDDHSSGRSNRRLLIWSLLSFEWWSRRFLN